MTNNDNKIVGSGNAINPAQIDRPTITLKGKNLPESSQNTELSKLTKSNSRAQETLNAALQNAASSIDTNSQGTDPQQVLQTKQVPPASSLSEQDVAVMNYVRGRDGQYLLDNESQFDRRGNTFRVTDGPLSGYRVVYKGGRNFQIRSPEGEPLMIYHGPRRRPRIAPADGEFSINSQKTPPLKEPEGS